MVQKIMAEVLSESVMRILIACLLAVMGWMAYTVQGLTVSTAVQTEALNSLRDQLIMVGNDRYTSAMAKSDKLEYLSTVSVLTNKVSNLQTWTENLSRRLADVENALRDSGK